MSMPWFRMYHEMIDDPKVGTLTDSQFRIWVEILCLACRAGNCGDTERTLKEIGWTLRRNVSRQIEELLDRGIIKINTDENGKETVKVTSWNKRQYQSDSSTERVQKHRGKKRDNDENETFQ